MGAVDGRWQMKQAIDRQIAAAAVAAEAAEASSWRRSGYSHQQTCFSTSTIADNDELSAEFGHFGGCDLGVEGLRLWGRIAGW